MIYNRDSEHAVLGSIFLDPSTFEDIADKITARSFYEAANQRIFEVITETINSGDTPDIVVVADLLSQKYPDDDWLPLLASIESNTPSSQTGPKHAEHVAQYELLRKLHYGCEHAKNLTMDRAKLLPDRIEASRSAIAQVLDENTLQAESGPLSARQKISDFVQHQDTCAAAGDGITGLRTGFDCVDDRTGGLQAGNLMILAGRPSMGKTTLALNIVRDVAVNQGLNVLVFSVEMTTEELFQKLVSDIGDIQFNLVRRATYGNSIDRAQEAINVLSRADNLIFDDSSCISISELTSRARRQHRKTPLSLVVVDHLGLVSAEGDNETIKVGKVSRGLKRLAKLLKVPVLALCQLNRSCDTRDDKRPMLSDLRQSGDIEQDADCVAMVYREYVYNRSTKDPLSTELIWRKVRAGEIGTDHLVSQLQFSRFVSRENYVEVVPFQSQRKSK